MWGGALGLTGASGQGNRVPPRPSFGMDFVWYRTPLRGNASRWKDPDEALYRASVPGHAGGLLRGVTRPSGRETRRSHPLGVSPW